MNRRGLHLHRNLQTFIRPAIPPIWGRIARTVLPRALLALALVIATDAWAGQAPRSWRLLSGAFAAAAEAHEPETHEVVFGTGWVTASGYVVTCNHVIGEYDAITLIRPDGSRMAARLAARRPQDDIAILEVANRSMLPAGLSLAKAPPEPGARVFTIGYPLPDVLGLAPKLSSGRLDGLTGLDGDPRVYVLSLPIQMGNSGGPLVALTGEVVGMVAANLVAVRELPRPRRDSLDISFAVNAEYIQDLLDGLPALPSPPRRTVGQGRYTLEELGSAVAAATVLVAAHTREAHPPLGFGPRPRIERSDEARAQETLELGHTGRTGRWDNALTGNAFALTPLRNYRAYTLDGPRYCRDYQVTLISQGESLRTSASACRRQDGQWEIENLPAWPEK